VKAAQSWLSENWKIIPVYVVVAWFVVGAFGFETEFLPNPEFELPMYWLVASITLLLSIPAVVFIYKKRNDEPRTSPWKLWLILPFTPFLLGLFVWIMFARQVPFLITVVSGSVHEEVHVFVTSYSRSRRGNCEYRVRAADLKQKICIDKEQFDAIGNDNARPLQIIGKKSWLGFAVVDVIKAVPTILIPSGVQIIKRTEGAGATPKLGDTTKFKLSSSPVADYSNYSRQLDPVKSWSFKTMSPEMQEILGTMKVGDKSIVQCPTLADCGLKIEGQPQLQAQPFILEIELISSVPNGS